MKTIIDLRNEVKKEFGLNDNEFNLILNNGFLKFQFGNFEYINHFFDLNKTNLINGIHNFLSDREFLKDLGSDHPYFIDSMILKKKYLKNKK